MTNEELLQQAKDQVVKLINNPGIKKWEDVLMCYPHWTINEHFTNASLLAIQSAREEATPTLSKEDFFKLIGADWTHANANIIWDTLDQHGYRIQKLTAPGR